MSSIEVVPNTGGPSWALRLDSVDFNALTPGESALAKLMISL